MDVNAEVLQGGNVAHVACTLPVRLDFLKLFLTRGKADVTATTVHKETLLHHAVYEPRQSLEHTKFLLPFYDGPAFACPHFSHRDYSIQGDFFLEPAHIYDTVLRTAVASNGSFKEESLQEAILACPINTLSPTSAFASRSSAPNFPVYSTAQPQIQSMLYVSAPLYAFCRSLVGSSKLLLFPTSSSLKHITNLSSSSPSPNQNHCRRRPRRPNANCC